MFNNRCFSKSGGTNISSEADLISSAAFRRASYLLISSSNCSMTGLTAVQVLTRSGWRIARRMLRFLPEVRGSHRRWTVRYASKPFEAPTMRSSASPEVRVRRTRWIWSALSSKSSMAAIGRQPRTLIPCGSFQSRLPASK